MTKRWVEDPETPGDKSLLLETAFDHSPWVPEHGITDRILLNGLAFDRYYRIETQHKVTPFAAYRANRDANVAIRMMQIETRNGDFAYRMMMNKVGIPHG